MVSSSSTTAATAAARLQMPMLEGGNNNNTTRRAAAATAAAAAGRTTSTSPNSNSNSSNYHYNSNSEDDDYTPVHSNVGALEVESSSSNNNNWSSAGGTGEGTEGGGGGGHPHQHLEHTTQRIMSSPAAAVVVVVPPRTLPRWPRDLPWAVSFGCTVTTAVLWPVLHHHQQQHSSNSNSSSTVYAAHPLATASLHTLFWAAICAAMMSRYLYWYPAGGPDGDAKRCTIAATLVLAAPLSVVLNIVVAILILTQCPTAKLTALVPVWYTIRDVYLFRRWRRRRSFFTSPATSTTSATTMTTTTTGSNSRQAFFQALTVMALDLTSRSLRRASFYRVLVVILLGQWLTLLWARWALLQALSSSSSNAASVFFSMQFLVTLVAWKWITGTWARFLTLLASGGVMSWFVEQENRMAAGTTSTTTGVDSSSRNSRSMARRDDGGDDNDEVANAQDEVEEQDYDYSSAAATATGRHHNITEAYRTVDASVYSSVLDMEDVLDDDYEQDEEEFMEAPSPMLSFTTTTRSQQQRPSHFHHYQYPHSTVKSILYAGVRVSFGSIAQCGLLGGVAQFVWSQIRKVEYSQFVFCDGGGSSSSSSIYNISGNTDTSGFQGMPIGSAEASILTKLWIRLLSVARGFVQRYSDLAMCHVAVYYKGYSRAARDVAILVQESGVEPILHDDITTHMCACVGGAISSVIVLFTGLVLLHQRTKPTGVREEDIDAVSDAQVVINMMASFVFSYTLLFTVMEPLRAAIKAIYVCYAQYPVSMSRAFPIIYHRLHRLSEANR